MKRAPKMWMWAGAVLAMVGLLPGGATQAQAPSKKVKVAEGIRFIGYLPMYVAKEMKFFEREGLDVEVFVAGSRALAMQSVIAKEAVFSVHDPAGASLARKKGAKTKVVMPVANRFQYYLMVNSDRPVSDPPNLKGLTIALGTPPQTGYSLLVDFLSKNGFKEVENAVWQHGDSTDAKDGVRLLYVNFFTEISQVYARRANAVIVLPPYEAITARELGMKILPAYSASVGPMLFSTLNVLEETLEKDPETVQRFANALVKSFRWAHQNQDQVVKVAEKWFPSLHPVVINLAVKRMFAEGVYPKDGNMKREAFDANFNDLLVRAKDPAAGIAFDELVDTRFGERATKEAK